MDESFDIRWQNHSKEACEEVSRLYAAGAFADVLLYVEDEVFKAHRVILAACSAYFEKVFARMGETRSTPFVILRDTDAALFTLVVKFIYDGVVQVPCNLLRPFMTLAQGKMVLLLFFFFVM
jgi:hypothetical protein